MFFKLDSIFTQEVVLVQVYIYRVLGLFGIVSNNQVSIREVQNYRNKRYVVQVALYFVEGDCVGHYSVVSVSGARILGIGT